MFLVPALFGGRSILLVLEVIGGRLEMKMLALHILFATAVCAIIMGGLAQAEIACPGTYGGHLQGVATDKTSAIFWSFTVELVKTDMKGALLEQVTVPTHHGDLCYHDGKVYVAVNLGQFNQEAGKADSWVYVYDAKDLKLLAKHEVQEAVHGAGGMDAHKGHFFVVSGLPVGYEENYVYEYDADFKFIKRHVIKSGYTAVGIQTACHHEGRWWFGCYGEPPQLLQTSESFEMTVKANSRFGLGIAGISADLFLQGISKPLKDKKKWAGSVKYVHLNAKDGSFKEANKE
jgi:hypothetical protein